MEKNITQNQLLYAYSLLKDYIDEYWFENLNLRGDYKKVILDYIKEKYPKLYPKYIDIYMKKDNTYWQELALKINSYCEQNNLKYKNYFYHDKLVAEKKNKESDK